MLCRNIIHLIWFWAVGWGWCWTSWSLEMPSNPILLLSPILMLKVKELLCLPTPYGMCSRAGWEETMQHPFHVRLMVAQYLIQHCACLVSEFTRHQVLALEVLRITMLSLLHKRCCLILMGYFSLENLYQSQETISEVTGAGRLA